MQYNVSLYSDTSPLPDDDIPMLSLYTLPQASNRETPMFKEIKKKETRSEREEASN